MHDDISMKEQKDGCMEGYGVLRIDALRCVTHGTSMSIVKKTINIHLPTDDRTAFLELDTALL